MPCCLKFLGHVTDAVEYEGINTTLIPLPLVSLSLYVNTFAHHLEHLRYSLVRLVPSLRAHVLTFSYERIQRPISNRIYGENQWRKHPVNMSEKVEKIFGTEKLETNSEFRERMRMGM